MGNGAYSVGAVDVNMTSLSRFLFCLASCVGLWVNISM